MITRVFLTAILSCTIQFAKAQFSDKSMFHIEVDTISDWFDDYEVTLLVKATNTELPKRGFYHLTPIISFIHYQENNRVFHTDKPMFISVDKENSPNGLFREKVKVRIPKSKLSVRDKEFVITIKLVNNVLKQNWTMFSEPITIAHIYDKKTLNTSSTGQKTPNDALKINSIKYTINNNEIAFYSNLSNTSKIPYSTTIKLYRNGVACSQPTKKDHSADFKEEEIFYIPFVNIHVPTGKNTLTYEIIVESNDKKQKSTRKGEIIYTQPQLQILSFESKNVRINVESMDRPTPILNVLTNKKSTNGDAFFTIRNDNKIIFTSNITTNGGNVKDANQKIQIVPSTKLYITFYDHDILTKEFIQEFSIPLQLGGPYSRLINDKKILHFDFKYSLENVNNSNYKLN